MTELDLTRDLRLTLRARAHHLDPVVLLGAHGLTEAVLKEIERALVAHELIKVRAPLAERDAREELFAQIAHQLGAARVVHIGKLLVLFRPRPAEADGQRAAATGTAAPERNASRPRGRQAGRDRNDRGDRPSRVAVARPPRVARGRGR